jgi:hypothetical protein
MKLSSLNHKIILASTIAILVILTLVNYRQIATADLNIDSPGNITPYIAVDTAIPTPFGIFVTGTYGDSGDCEYCDGYDIENYIGFQLGGFGTYIAIRLK